MPFKAIVSLLIFCLDDLSVDGNAVLNSPTLPVLLSMISFMFIIVLFVFSYVGGLNIYNC